MDEPLSNLDAKLRVGMRASLAQLHERLGVDDRLRHARPDRGDDARPARRGHAQRADPPGRRAAAALPRAARPLRRRVHRLAGDEPRRGDARRATTSRSASSGFRSTRGRRPRDGVGRVVARHPARVLRGRGASHRPACRRSSRPSRSSRSSAPTPTCSSPSTRRRSPRSRSRPPRTTRPRCSATRRALFTARVDARTAATSAATLRLAVDPAPLPLLRSGHRREPPRGASPPGARRPRREAAGACMTETKRPDARAACST